MSEHIRFGDYQYELGYGYDECSFNALTPKLERDSQGRLIPYQPTPIKLMPGEVFDLLRPYVSVRLMDQVKSVVPLALYLALFQLLILRQLVQDSWAITGGLFAVIVGLMFFMEGLKLGLMPFGTVIGKRLPQKSPLPIGQAITAKITLTHSVIHHASPRDRGDLRRARYRGLKGGWAERGC